jgi:hypothetical protein
MQRLFITTLIAATLLVSGASARAADEGKDQSAEASKAEKKPKQLPFRGKVSAVDKAGQTVSLKGKEKSRTFQLTSESKITKDGNPADIDQINVGESVGGLARENAAGQKEVLTLNVGAKPAKARSEKRKKNKE